METNWVTDMHYVSQKHVENSQSGTTRSDVNSFIAGSTNS